MPSPASDKEKAVIAKLLAEAGIELGGSRPWDVRVHDERVYARVLRHGSLGLGEAYMDGWWDAERVDAFIYRLLMVDLRAHIRLDLPLILLGLRSLFSNGQRRHAARVGERHYDIGNDLYRRMLDPLMVYSCGYWREADTLATAQEAKLDLVCRKLGLQPGMRVLDIGSGWGGFLKFAAERYGVSGVGVTVSKEQAAHARAASEGLPVETLLMDYMGLEGRFDRIVSIGMFEHVGYKNYAPYLAKVRSLLEEDGLFLLHSIGGNTSVRSGDPWMEKYIFPNGMLPSPRQVTAAAETRLIIEDWHNFGPYYDRTLMAWHDNFNAAWPDLEPRYGERFGRMWRYYLLSSAALFRARQAQLWQIVLSPRGVPGGYQSIR